MAFKIWIKEMRIPFLTASLIPVFLGGAYASATLDPFLFLLTLIGVLSLHSGANIVNDFFDFRNGTDLSNKNRSNFSGGSGLLPELNPSSVYRTALLFFAIGAVAGLYLFILRGPIILILGLIGFISGYSYTSPKINFSSRGLGEVLVFLNFGILITLGTVFVQTSSLSLTTIIISLPVAFLITAVLFINQFPDYKADKKAGKKNLVVRLGRKKSVKIYESLMILTYISIILAVSLSYFPLISLISLATIPLAVKSIKTLRVHHSSFPHILPANASTIMNHLLTGVILIVSLLI
jgi:1,4-dihydroxy-2-naphthoate octaprenyltransferase